MNNLFIKNIEALRQRNSELAVKLQTYIPTEIPELVQKNNFYNILYKNNLIHNEQNPLAEAQEIFSNAENSPTSIHIIYGLGLGYLFQLTSLKSQGCVILYETDLNILWLTFSLVDLSNDILKQNIFICSIYEELTAILHQKSNIQNTPVLLSLPSVRNSSLEEFNNFVKRLQDTVGSFYLDLKFTKQKIYPSLKMLIQNMPSLLKEIPLTKIKDSYNGKTAVIVSAGPTLDKNLEILKKYRNKYILFTVGTALKTLISNGIEPDYLCIIETYNSSRQIENMDLSNINFITEPYSNPALRNFRFKNIYSHISSNNPINQFWSEICKENIEEYLSKGTVSYTALNSARILGCSKIILVGQDLAYINGQCYSKDSVYKDLVIQFNKEFDKWEIVAKDFEKFAQAISASNNKEIQAKTAHNRLKNLNDSLYYVKGIKGEMLPTESVYATFIEPLKEFTKTYSDREYINTSLIGAQIDGFKNLSLEEALRTSEVVGNIELKNNFEFDSQNIKNNLNSKLKELKTSIEFINEGKKLCKNLNNEIKRHRNPNQEVLKSLKKVSINYANISTSFAEESALFNFIISSFKSDIDYEMKILKDFTIENIININEKLANFYENIEQRILEIERLINESINSES